MEKFKYRISSLAFLVCVCMLLINVKVYAASNIATIIASGNTQEATVRGTTDDDVAAVLIEIMDENNQIITLETHAVTDGAYNATLSCSLSEGRTYTAYVANYNGSGNSKSTTFTIPVPVNEVTLNKTTETITIADGTVQLTATVLPVNASNQNVIWSTDNASVATVDTNGKVTAHANGTAHIKVTTEDGGKTAIATITVAVNTNNTEDDNDDNTGNQGGQGSTDDNTGNQGGQGSTDDNTENQGGQGSTDDNTGNQGGQGSTDNNTGNQGGQGSTDNNGTSQDNSSDSITKPVSVPIDYIVVRGDTLSRIARRNQISLAALLALNPQIKNPNLIRPGQRIIIGYTSNVEEQNTSETDTSAVYYVIKRGDTLYKIARRNKMNLSQLIALNPKLAYQRYIYAGQKVRVK